MQEYNERNIANMLCGLVGWRRFCVFGAITISGLPRLRIIPKEPSTLIKWIDSFVAEAKLANVEPAAAVDLAIRWLASKRKSMANK